MSEDCLAVGGCRICEGPLSEPFLDLGLMPLANDYQAEPGAACRRFPLAVWECGCCGLVQLTHVVAPAVLFDDYAYLTSCSSPMVAHFEAFAREFASPGARMVDIGSNDGTLGAAFAARGCMAIGIEPARNVESKILKVARFLDEAAVSEALDLMRDKADIVTATNVCAHVDGLFDFLRCVRALLADGGLFIAEWPDWTRTVEAGAFDQIYHEHLSYFTLETFIRALRLAGLSFIRADQIPVHGGSLRILSIPSWSRHIIPMSYRNSDVAVFVRAARETMEALPSFLEPWRGRIAGYGAPAKATTLLNAAGVDAPLLPYTVDSTPSKIGRYIPGTSIPIRAESDLGQPDCALILAWNFAEAIRAKLPAGMQAAVPVPTPRLI